MLSENIENDSGPVDDFDADCVLERTPLRRSKIPVYNNGVRLRLLDNFP